MKALDLASLALIAGAVLAGFAFRRVRLDPALAAFAALVFILYCAIPNSLMGGYYADLRLLPVAWMAGLAACRIVGPAPHVRHVLAGLGIALFALRVGVTAHAWQGRGAGLEAELGALEFIPVGARVFALTPDRNCRSWANESLSHLPSLAIVRRDAYVNTEWDLPGQQLMRPRYARGIGFDTWATLAPPGGDCAGRSLDNALSGFPRDRFDFLWIFDAQLPPSARAWLEPLFDGPRGSLYAVRRSRSDEPVEPAERLPAAPIG